MIPDIAIAVTLIDTNQERGTAWNVIEGKVRQSTGATSVQDQEENAVRLGEQMIREAFKRLREKQGAKA